MIIYNDLVALFMGERDYAKAKEMATLLERQSRLLGYPDLAEKASIALENCTSKASSFEAAAAHVADFGPSAEQTVAFHASEYRKPGMGNEAQEFQIQTDGIIGINAQENAKESLQKKAQNLDYEILLERLPASYESGKHN